MSRLRRAEELASDPQTHLMTGRLIGAAEMMARYMQVHGDEQAQQMGERVDGILTFFFIDHVSTSKELERRK